MPNGEYGIIPTNVKEQMLRTFEINLNNAATQLEALGLIVSQFPKNQKLQEFCDTLRMYIAKDGNLPFNFLNELIDSAIANVKAEDPFAQLVIDLFLKRAKVLAQLSAKPNPYQKVIERNASTATKSPPTKSQATEKNQYASIAEVFGRGNVAKPVPQYGTSTLKKIPQSPTKEAVHYSTIPKVKFDKVISEVNKAEGYNDIEKILNNYYPYNVDIKAFAQFIATKELAYETLNKIHVLRENIFSKPEYKDEQLKEVVRAIEKKLLDLKRVKPQTQYQEFIPTSDERKGLLEQKIKPAQLTETKRSWKDFFKQPSLNIKPIIPEIKRWGTNLFSLVKKAINWVANLIPGKGKLSQGKAITTSSTTPTSPHIDEPKQETIQGTKRAEQHELQHMGGVFTPKQKKTTKAKSENVVKGDVVETDEKKHYRKIPKNQ